MSTGYAQEGAMNWGGYFKVQGANLLIFLVILAVLAVIAIASGQSL